jgi:signal transduction histidine kinase
VNAVEAVTGADGPREVWVTTEADADHVVIAVRDTGPGVDLGQIDLLFRPFYTTKPHGLGMGLTISRSIVEAHGGQLSATPSAPRGAVFRVTLPAGAAEKVA